MRSSSASPRCGKSRSSVRYGKLAFGATDRRYRAELGFQFLPITGAHAEHAGGLPRHHNDPFDRLIIAQAYLEGMVLGTQDPLMRPYPVPLLGLAQYTAPRAVIGQTASTRSPRTATYRKRRHSGRSAAESRNRGTPAGGHLGRRRCSWVPGSARGRPRNDRGWVIPATAHGEGPGEIQEHRPEVAWAGGGVHGFRVPPAGGPGMTGAGSFRPQRSGEPESRNTGRRSLGQAAVFMGSGFRLARAAPE